MKNNVLLLLSALANDIRLRCMVLIQTEGELCVCELMHALGMSQPMISRHLAVLRDTGLVSDRRSGQWVHYSVNPELDDDAVGIIKACVAAASQQQPHSNDIQQLHAMQNRPEHRFREQCCS